MSEREQKLRELITKLEKQGCYCDVRAGWSCPMHGYLREVEALLVKPQPAPKAMSTWGASEHITVLPEEQLQPASPSLSADWPECEEFYNLMQAYRHEPVGHVVTIKQNYEAVKSWLRDRLGAAKPAAVQEPCKNCGFDEFVHQVPCVTWEQREAEIRDRVLGRVIEMLLPYEEEGKPCQATLCATCTIARVRALKSQVSVTERREPTQGASHDK